MDINCFTLVRTLLHSVRCVAAATLAVAVALQYFFSLLFRTQCRRTMKHKHITTLK